MTPCATCGHHLRPGRAEPCHHCSAQPSALTPRMTAAAILLGLGLSACGGDTNTSPQPLYGVTVTDTADTGDAEQ